MIFEDHKPHNNEDYIKHEKEVAIGELTPKDRLENQMRLATILYAQLHEKNFDIETLKGRNSIMEFWTNESEKEKSYSACYREIETDPKFNSHQRFKGDIFKITVDDIIYYKENGELPLE